MNIILELTRYLLPLAIFAAFALRGSKPKVIGLIQVALMLVIYAIVRYANSQIAITLDTAQFTIALILSSVLGFLALISILSRPFEKILMRLFGVNETTSR